MAPNGVLLVSACVVLAAVGTSIGAKDEFHEELFIKPFPTGHLYNHFQFTTTWDVQLGKADSFLHYHLFPKALGEVLSKYSVQELHLTLTQGLWRHEKWGYPVVDASPGAEVWAWFQEGTLGIDQVWTDLINVLSGMFCASLNFMDATNTVIPRLAFRPQGVTSDLYKRQGDHLARYASLPRESVCTENLTPWKKLLPCGTQVGLASLLNAFKLYDATYSSLGLHFRPICRDPACNQTSVELSLNAGIVFEPTTAGGSGGKQDWSLKRLFNRVLSTSCPLATTSQISVDITDNKGSGALTLAPEPTRVTEVTRGHHKVLYAVYEIAEFLVDGRALTLGARYPASVRYQKVTPPVVHANRFQTGYGQQNGGIVCLLYNHHPSKDLSVVYMEVVPWFLRVYLHTLSIQAFRGATRDIDVTGATIEPDHMYYTPGRDRQRPYHLELVLTLPADSVTRISFQFERALLKWTEYPPDANHGFYVNSAVISTVIEEGKHYTAAPQDSARISAILSDNHTSPFFLRLHTESLLVSLPTPDFSMPYNVICLACTVVAIAFGSIHNLTTRRFVVKDPTKKTGLLAKIKAKLSWRKAKPTLAEEEVVQNDDERVSDKGDADFENLDQRDTEEAEETSTSHSHKGAETSNVHSKKRRHKYTES